MRGGRAAVSGREGKARLLVACTLFLQGHGWKERMPGKGTPRGIEKNFLQMSRLGTCWQCFLKIPATGLYAR